MEEIRLAFADKHFDERVLHLISNFIKEFDDLFGKYVPREEVIRRISENLDKIEFDYEFEDEHVNGQYNGFKKEICLAKIDNEEELKSFIFHEMIHCITRNQEEGVTGFSRTLEIEDLYEIKIVTCHGLTEGFTEYATKKRDEKYAPDLQLTVYPILTEQIENLVDLIGEETFFDIAFNRPKDLGKELGLEDEFGIGLYAEEFYDAFDKIWKKEEEIYTEKHINGTPEGKLFEALFGKQFSFREDDYTNIEEAKRIIIENWKRILLSQPITTVRKFNSAYWKICKYAEQLNMKLEASMFDELLNHIKYIERSGKSMDEILGEITPDARILVKSKMFVEEFKELSKEEKIERLTQESFFDQMEEYEILGSGYEVEIFSKMGGSIIKTDSSDRDCYLFLQLLDGLAQVIIDRGYNIDALGIEYIDFNANGREDVGRIYDRMVFNLYDNSTEKCIYLGTFYDDGEEILEFLPSDANEVVEEYPRLAGSAILSTKLDEILAYTGDNEYILIDRNNRVRFSQEITYCPSEIQLLQERLSSKMARLQRLKNLNAPDGLISMEKKLAQETIKKIQQIKNKSKISQEEIESEVGNISLEEMQEIMGDLTNTEEKRQDALERGIGYGEK